MEEDEENQEEVSSEEEEMTEEMMEEELEEELKDEEEDKRDHSTTYQGYGRKVKSDIVPSPDSKFLTVVCGKCKSKQVIFSKTATVVKCQNCQEELSVPTGGNSRVNAKVERVLG
jgi:ribosomal protein S27E